MKFTIMFSMLQFSYLDWFLEWGNLFPQCLRLNANVLELYVPMLFLCLAIWRGLDGFIQRSLVVMENRAKGKVKIEFDITTSKIINKSLGYHIFIYLFIIAHVKITTNNIAYVCLQVHLRLQFQVILRTYLFIFFL